MRVCHGEKKVIYQAAQKMSKLYQISLIYQYLIYFYTLNLRNGLIKGANVSNFNPNGNQSAKRERFNSDCSQKKTVTDDTLVDNNLPQVNIDPKLVKYDLNGKIFFLKLKKKNFAFNKKNFTL